MDEERQGQQQLHGSVNNLILSIYVQTWLLGAIEIERIEQMLFGLQPNEGQAHSVHFNLLQPSPDDISVVRGGVGNGYHLSTSMTFFRKDLVSIITFLMTRGETYAVQRALMAVLAAHQFECPRYPGQQENE